MTVALPGADDGVFSVIGYAFDAPSDERTVHVDQYGGDVVSTYGFEDYPTLAKVVAQGIGLHEGRTFGPWSMAGSTRDVPAGHRVVRDRSADVVEAAAVGLARVRRGVGCRCAGRRCCWSGWSRWGSRCRSSGCRCSWCSCSTSSSSAGCRRCRRGSGAS